MDADQLDGYISRIADSLERLVETSEQPMFEVEPSPPQCPHCGVVNPDVIIDSDGGGDGEAHKLTDFVLVCLCMHCHNHVYAVVNHWVVHPGREAAIENIMLIKERTGKLNVIAS